MLFTTLAALGSLGVRADDDAPEAAAAASPASPAQPGSAEEFEESLDPGTVPGKLGVAAAANKQLLSETHALLVTCQVLCLHE